MNISPHDLRKNLESGIRVSRPGSTSSDDSTAPEGKDIAASRSRSRSSAAGLWMLAGVIVVVLGVAAFILKDRFFASSQGAIKAGNAQFQAVFLTNGQVYFGKLSNVQNQYVTLENIYYLQVTPVLQTKTEGQPGSQASSQQQQLSLVKLGNELHGPVDKMSINRDQILFFEDLKDDGRVVKAIREFEHPGKK